MIDEQPLQQVLRKLKSVFPEAITEEQRKGGDGNSYYAYALKGEFIEQLRGAGIDLVDDQNRYELQFPGKQLADATTAVPCYKTLISDKEQSVNFDTTNNIFIEGDNLDALRMLKESYRGRVKMIYIDPPYNTGSDNFVYDDDFSIAQKEYLKKAGVLDEDGERQVSEIQTGLRGRFHAGWLAFMYPRLKLARELLSEGGVIFISIDENQQANLKLLCNEIFGEDNMICTLHVEMSITQGMKVSAAQKGHIVKNAEYALFYAKNNVDEIKLNSLHEARDWDEHYSIYYDKANDKRISLLEKIKQSLQSGELKIKVTGKFQSSDIAILYSGNEQFRKFIHANSSNIYRDAMCEKKFNLIDKQQSQLQNGNIVRIPENGRDYLIFKNSNGVVRQLLCLEMAIGNTNDFSSRHGLRRIRGNWWCDYYKDMMNVGKEGGVDYKNGKKPIRLIMDMLKLIPQTDFIVLDFFAGSATTAHAVMRLNAEDGGSRKFIMVQLPEKIDSKKSKKAYQFCTQDIKRPATVAEIAKERIRRSGKQIVESQNGDLFAKNVDTGFRAFVVQDSLLNNGEQKPLVGVEQPELGVYITKLMIENFEPLLYETLLKTGVTLDLPLGVHEVNGYPFAICDDRCYCVTENLTQKVVQEITKKHSGEFDILYYLSDALSPTTSYTEIEAAVLNELNKNIDVKALTFY